MNMKKSLLLIVFLPLMLLAEPVEHENILKIKYGGVWQQDSYLSPLRYTGQEVGIGNEWWQSFSRYEHWAHVGMLDIRGCWFANSAKTNKIYGADLQFGWGAYYHWDWAEQGVQILLGPYLEAELMGRYMVTNVNKPYSMDAGVQVFAMTGLRWCFSGKKTSYRLGYTLRANMIGVDYLPEYFESYYEITEGVHGQVRCAGLWNHQAINQQLSLDLQFPHSTWRVGLEHQFLNYGTRNMSMQRNQIDLVVGCIWHYKIHPAKPFKTNRK